jgi:hypothetical protein
MGNGYGGFSSPAVLSLPTKKIFLFPAIPVLVWLTKLANLRGRLRLVQIPRIKEVT